MKYLRKINSRGFSHHLLLPILVIVLVAAIGAHILTKSRAATNSLALDANSFGLATGAAIWGETSAEQATEFDRLQQMGVKWIRVDVPWKQVEPYTPTGSALTYQGKQHTYHWDKLDYVVNLANTHGIKIIGQVGNAPAWANPTLPQGVSYQFSQDPNNYAGFVAALANRYMAKGMVAFEAGNEININGKTADVYHDPGPYADLLCKVHSQVQKVNSTLVVLPSVLSAKGQNGNYSGEGFATGLYASSAQKGVDFRNCYDAFGYHPYTTPMMPGDTSYPWQSMFKVRTVMAQYGDANKPLWITEYGAPTEGKTDASGNPLDKHISEAAQAEMVKEAYTLFDSYSWHGPLCWFQYQDQGANPSDQHDWYGLYRPDGSAKPAVQAYKDLTQTAL